MMERMQWLCAGISCSKCPEVACECGCHVCPLHEQAPGLGLHKAMVMVNKH